MIRPVPHEPPATEPEENAVIGGRRWTLLYLAVLACFVIYVVVLAIFTHAFS
jgi:hypothetical protein